MNAIKIGAIALVIAGVLALAYGGFTYTKSSSSTDLGPIELTVKDRETVNIPMWGGIGAIVIGGVLFLVGLKKIRI